MKLCENDFSVTQMTERMLEEKTYMDNGYAINKRQQHHNING